MCSTPFGITEYISTIQRYLAANSEQCSTPFGITEYIRVTAATDDAA